MYIKPSEKENSLASRIYYNLEDHWEGMRIGKNRYPIDPITNEVQKSKDPFYEVVGNVQQYEDQFLDNLLTVNENEEELEFSENEDEERGR